MTNGTGGLKVAPGLMKPRYRLRGSRPQGRVTEQFCVPRQAVGVFFGAGEKVIHGSLTPVVTTTICLGFGNVREQRRKMHIKRYGYR